MSFGIRKSFKVAPGIRFNVSTKSMGLSVGVKGLRYSVNTRGQRRTTTSIPGTGLSYTSTSSSRSGRRYHSSAYQARSELAKREREAQKLQELERNRLEVEMFENRLEMIKSIHKECDDIFNWSEIKDTPPPFQQGEKGPRELDAILKLEQYRPGFFAKLFKKVEKQRAALMQQIESAKHEDINDYNEWQKLVQTATSVCAGDIDMYFEVIEDLAPLDDLSEFGSGFEFFAQEPHFIEIEFDVKSEEVVPKEMKSLTKTGKVSVKDLPKSKFFDIQQDYVCSCVLRIARDMFSILPLEYVVVHALDEQMNTSTGYMEKVVILSVKIDRETLNRLNFELIDCSDSMKNFEHRMKFKKTGGFEPVQKIALAL